jgi:hypothetical protein
MSREEYRQHARECFSAAELATRPDMKAVLMSMAERWLELAERTKRLAVVERLAAHRAPGRVN